MNLRLAGSPVAHSHPTELPLGAACSAHTALHPSIPTDTEVNNAHWESPRTRSGEGKWEQSWRAVLCLAALPCYKLGPEGTLATPSFQQMTITHGRAKPWCSCPGSSWASSSPIPCPTCQRLAQPPNTLTKWQHHDNSHLPPH